MRSTTQRYRPSRSEESIPRRAMRGVMPRAAGHGVGPRNRRPCRRGVWRALAGSARLASWADDGWDGIDEREQLRRVVRVGGREPHGERDAVDPPRGGTWSRACRGRPGSAQSARPPFGPDTQAVHAGPGPVDGRLVTQPIQQRLVQPCPHPGFLPVTQPSPAGRAAAAAKFLRQEAATDSPSAGRRRCRRGRPGPGYAGDRPSASAAPSAAEARWLPTGRRGQGMRRS